MQTSPCRAQSFGRQVQEAKPLVDAAQQKVTEGKQLADDYGQYEAERAAVQLLLDDLKAHAQKKAIATESPISKGT